MSPLYRNKKDQTQKDFEVTQIRIVREDLINKAREQAFPMMQIFMTRRLIQIVC